MTPAELLEKGLSNAQYKQQTRFRRHVTELESDWLCLRPIGGRGEAAQELQALRPAQRALPEHGPVEQGARLVF